MTFREAMVRRWVFLFVSVSVALYTLVVMPVVIVLVVHAQGVERQQRTQADCMERSQNRAALLDAVDTLTEPLPIEPDRIESSEFRTFIIVRNQQNDETRTAIHDHLLPIDC